MYRHSIVSCNKRLVRTAIVCTNLAFYLRREGMFLEPAVQHKKPYFIVHLQGIYTLNIALASALLPYRNVKLEVNLCLTLLIEVEH